MQTSSHEGKAVLMQRSSDEDEAGEMQQNHDEAKAVVMQRCTQGDQAEEKRGTRQKDKTEREQ